MIRATVRYADGNGAPPPELSKVFKWRTWGVLPRAGGTDDQRAGELDRMLACANAYDVWTIYKRGGLKNMTPKQIEMLRELKELDLA